ncbi:MAG: hypothetical protein CBB97_24045 [Candidatus Endolissoclinum sp. TMED37]|nr:MAG: hypothetical protein CBB97_24045 [Candidatus Endolissoclinum sp. TMED37]|tara:strand:+ start:903 stop:1973 length:1071 start_codon:yes stop_codon:yes gene_type:complete
MLVFDSKHFMTSSNLVYKNERYLWETTRPEEAMTITGARSFDHFSKLFGFEVEPLIPEKYQNSASLLNSEPPWCFYIGKTKFQKMIHDFAAQHDKVLEKIDEETIISHTKINYFIDSMEPATYDLRLVQDQDLKKHIDKFIIPNLSDGKLDAVRYIRTKTKTGRLTVVAGPNVLTMHSGLRKGVIDGYSIDFVSIEPNVLLVSQNRKPRTDIYDEIRREVFKDSISRAKVKIATMAALYGSGRQDKFAKNIEDYFKVDETVSILESQVVDDRIKNLFDRPIFLNGARGKHLLALWLQSSAADAALLGFYNFAKQVEIVPHWIIHDGLIFIYKDKQKETLELDVGLSYNLPVKVEKL